MTHGDGDTAPGDTPAVSPTRPGDEEPLPVAEAERGADSSDTSQGAPPTVRVPGANGTISGEAGAQTPRYRRSPGWASRWIRGQLLVRHRSGTEVGCIGSAAITWMALGSSLTTAGPATATSASSAIEPVDSGQPFSSGVTAAELAERIELVWPAVGAVTVNAVEEALSLLLTNALVEELPAHQNG